MKLILRTLTGININVDNVKPTDYIWKLKYIVKKNINYPVNQTHLLYKGDHLFDHKQIKDYDLYDDSVIYVVLKLRGD